MCEQHKYKGRTVSFNFFEIRRMCELKEQKGKKTKYIVYMDYRITIRASINSYTYISIWRATQWLLPLYVSNSNFYFLYTLVVYHILLVRRNNEKLSYIYCI
jgi:hypothetical protein